MNSQFAVIVLVAVICLLVVGCLLFFGFLLHRLRCKGGPFLEEMVHRWLGGPRSEAKVLSNIVEEYLNRRNEFWTLYGQFILSAFVIVCITILLLTKTISAEAGLPILSRVGGFAIGKGSTSGRTTFTGGEGG
jgi:hypothetical protein